jgi:hypothetical protein
VAIIERCSKRSGGLTAVAGWRCDAEVPGAALRSRFALPGVVARPLEAGLRTVR